MNILQVLIGIAGGSVGALFLTRFLDRRLLTYSAEGVTVIEKRDQIDGLSITHKGHAVERLTRSHIRLWNAGRKAIEPGDVVSTNPLKVQYPGARLLDLKVVHSTDDAIKLRSRPDGDGWLIEFEYWEGKSGVVLEALHTSTHVVPKWTGSVRGLHLSDRRDRRPARLAVRVQCPRPVGWHAMGRCRTVDALRVRVRCGARLSGCRWKHI